MNEKKPTSARRADSTPDLTVYVRRPTMLFSDFILFFSLKFIFIFFKLF
jgi:hypothetical protein